MRILLFILLFASVVLGQYRVRGIDFQQSAKDTIDARAKIIIVDSLATFSRTLDFDSVRAIINDSLSRYDVLKSRIAINIENIIAQINSLDKPEIKICLYGNSIFNATGGNYFPGSAGTLPWKLTYHNLARAIYDSIATNHATYRQINHGDWSTTGSWTKQYPFIYPVYQNSNDQVLESNTDGSTASIQVTDVSYIQFLFENVGLIQTGNYNYTNYLVNSTTGTGKGTMEVSTDGGSTWWSPSDSLYDINSDTTYGIFISATDTIDTYFSAVSPYSATDYQQSSYHSVGYMLDSSKTYDFKITYDSTAADVARGPLRLFGCYYWTGKTVTVYNCSNPGDNWDLLRRQMYGLIETPQWDLIIFETPFWNNGGYSTISANDIAVNSFLWQASKTSGSWLINSCMPGGIHPTGYWSVDAWIYTPGHNIMVDTVKYGGVALNIDGEHRRYKEAFEIWNSHAKWIAGKYGHAYIDTYRLFELYVESKKDSLASEGWVVPTTSSYYIDNGWDADSPGHGWPADSILVNTMTRFVDKADGHHPSQAGLYKWYEFLNHYLFSKLEF